MGEPWWELGVKLTTLFTNEHQEKWIIELVKIFWIYKLI
jgi:hypothetical protein